MVVVGITLVVGRMVVVGITLVVGRMVVVGITLVVGRMVVVGITLVVGRMVVVGITLVVGRTVVVVAGAQPLWHAQTCLSMGSSCQAVINQPTIPWICRWVTTNTVSCRNRCVARGSWMTCRTSIHCVNYAGYSALWHGTTTTLYCLI